MSNDEADKPVAQVANDKANNFFGFMIYWGIPIILLFSVSLVDFSVFYKQILVIVALTWMGLGCVVNAVNCKRVHCIFTGPWFLLGATVQLMDLLDIIQLSNNQTTAAVNITIFGAAIIWFVSEKIWGKYW